MYSARQELEPVKYFQIVQLTLLWEFASLNDCRLPSVYSGHKQVWLQWCPTTPIWDALPPTSIWHQYHKVKAKIARRLPVEHPHLEARTIDLREPRKALMAGSEPFQSIIAYYISPCLLLGKVPCIRANCWSILKSPNMRHDMLIPLKSSLDGIASLSCLCHE